MLDIDTIGTFEPVIFTIDGDEREGEDYFDDVSIPLTLEEFYISVMNSAKSWNETLDIMMEYLNRLNDRWDVLNVVACEKDEELNDLHKQRKHLESINGQLVNLVRYVERKVFLLSREAFKRMKVIKRKLEHKQLLQSIIDQVMLKNQKMQAEVQELQRQLSIRLRHHF